MGRRQRGHQAGLRRPDPRHQRGVIGLPAAHESHGDADFDSWVERNLPISPAEAAALIDFSDDPVIQGIDVSPAVAVSITKAIELTARLADHRVVVPPSVDARANRRRKPAEGSSAPGHCGHTGGVRRAGRHVPR